MDYIRDSMCGPLNRDHLITPADIHDIKHQYNINCMQKARMFEKHANKLKCVDATHGTTAYDFQLVTVLVIDDYNEGIPVAWLISNKETTDILKAFFSSLRERCGDIHTQRCL